MGIGKQGSFQKRVLILLGRIYQKYCFIEFAFQQSYQRQQKKMKKNIVSPFIDLIWNIIQDPDIDHIITWNQNGTSFCILDAEVFATEILSKHFKHANLSSFVRQLNMYNFHKNKNNVKELEFFHKLFRRDAKEILVGIKRKPSETDQIEGDQLLKNFLAKKYNQIQVRSQSQNDHLKQDQRTESTSVVPRNRKLSLTFDQTQKLTPFFEFHNFTPKRIPNIILINNFQQI